MDAISANDTGLPTGVAERLAQFSEWTGAPLFSSEDVFDTCEDGGRTFSDAFLIYCGQNGLSIDWVWLNEPRSLVIEAFHAAKGGAA